MKPVRRTVLVLVSLLIVAGVIGYLAIDGMIKSTVEKQSTTSLKLTTTLNRSAMPFGLRAASTASRTASTTDPTNA